MNLLNTKIFATFTAFVFFIMFLNLTSCSNNENKIYLTQDNYFNIDSNETNTQIDTNINNNFIEYNLDTNINKPIYKVLRNNQDDYFIYLSYSLQTNFESLKNNINKDKNSNIYFIKQQDDYLFKKYKIENNFINELTLKLNKDLINIMIVSNDSVYLTSKFNFQNIKNRISN